jgi:hypothetical protein
MEMVAMSDNRREEQTNNSLTLYKVSELSQLSGLKKQALRRYDRLGLLHPFISLRDLECFKSFYMNGTMQGKTNPSSSLICH